MNIMGRSALRSFSVVLLILLTSGIFYQASAQSAGDYRSAATGDWTSLPTWQRYSGTTWSTPTSAQGYPGQNTGTGAVTIQAGHTVTISSSGITTQTFTSLSIANTGQLYLNGTNTQITYSINTPVIDIALGGSIYFNNKVKLNLTANAAVTLAINQGGLTGSCNNNDEIWIGGQVFARCAGAPGNIFTFAQLMASGGTLNSMPSSNSPICQGSTISLTGSYGGAIGNPVTYSWSVTAPNSSTTTYATQNVSIPSASSGTYTATLTVTTVLAGTTYTNAETISVTVNPLPTLSGASQARTVCDGTSATINLTGLLSNKTFSLTYTINSGTPTQITGLTSSADGTSSFTTTTLSYSNDGQILQITGITITSASPNCASSFATNVTLSVWPTTSVYWTGATSTDWNVASNWCGNAVPTSTTDVTIPSSSYATNQPTIGSSGGICRNITISSGATLTISSSNTLNVYGNWSNSGTFTANSSTVNFTGSAASTLGGSGNTFNNLTISNTAGITAGSDITVNGILNLSAANPSSSSTKGCLEMVISYGSYPRTNSSTTYVPITSYILTMGPNSSTTGTGDVTGKIYRNSLSANTAYSFGNQFTTYAFTVAPTNVTVIVTIGAAYGGDGGGTPWGYPTSVKRSYEMNPTGGAGAVVTMSLHYLDSELNGNTENNLVTGDFDVQGGVPTGDEHGRSSYDFTNNYIGLTGVPISYFTQVWHTIFNLRNYSTGTKTWNGSTSGNWYTEANWTPSGIPGVGDRIIIPDAASTTFDPSLPASLTLGGLQILSGGILGNLSGNTVTIDASTYGNGWEDQSGSSTYSGSTVIISSTILSNYSTPVLGNPRFNNLTINTGSSVTVESNTHMYISGSLTKNGSFNANSYANTVEYNGAAQSVVLPDDQYSSLILSGSGIKTLPTSAMTVASNFELAGTISMTPTHTLSIGGNFTLGSGTTFIGGSPTHNLAGNWVNNGTTFTNTGSTINLNGSSAQALGGTASTTFNNLTVNNSAGVTLGIGETVDGTLTLTNGLITTGSYILTSGCSGNISSASSSSYINGKLARLYCSAGSKDFPVGKGGNFRQLTLNCTVFSDISTVTAEQFESTISGSLPANTVPQTGRFWLITESGGSTYSLTLNGSPFTPGSSGTAKILKGDGSSNTALSASFSSPNFTSTGITSFSNFAVASECAAPTITGQPSSASGCSGTGTVTFTVTSTVPAGTPTYQWEESTTGTSGTFVAITNGGIYSNATTAALTLTSPTSGMNGYAYRLVISRDCGSSVTSDTVTLNMNSLPTITLGSNPSVCSGTTSTSLSYSATTGIPDLYKIDYDAEAITAGFANVAYTSLPSSPITLTVPGAAPAGTYNGTLYVKKSTTLCESSAYAFTITISSAPQGSLSGNNICSGGTGYLTWTATEGNGPFTVVYNPGAVSVSNVVSGTAFSVGTLTNTTTYTLVSVTGANTCSRSSGFTGGSADVTVRSSGVVNTWDGSEGTDWFAAANWDLNYVPVSCNDVVISIASNLPTLTSSVQCNNLTINSGASLTIAAGKSLTVTGTLTNNANSEGLIIKSDNSGTGSLIESSTGISARVERYLSSDSWHLISSPISGAVSGMFLSQYLRPFNEPTNAFGDYITSLTTPLTAGQGFIIWPVTSQAYIYDGTLNTGTVTSSLSYTDASHGNNLVGNPYPSSVDWELVSAANLNVSTSMQIWNQSAGAYGVYSATTHSGTNGTTQYIPVGQGFFVTTTSAGSLSITHSMKVHNHTQSFLKNIDNVSNQIKIKVENETSSDEIIVAFLPSGSDGYNPLIDARKMFGEPKSPQLFLNKPKNTEKLSIGVLPELTGPVILPINLRVGHTGDYSFTSSTMESFNPNVSIVLEDVKLHEIQDLRVNPEYKFSADSNENENRFLLHISNWPYGTSPDPANEKFRIYSYGKTIYVFDDSGDCQSGTLIIYDFLGRNVYRSDLTGGRLQQFNPDLLQGYYIVKVISTSGVRTQKVFIH